MMEIAEHQYKDTRVRKHGCLHEINIGEWNLSQYCFVLHNTDTQMWFSGKESNHVSINI